MGCAELISLVGYTDCLELIYVIGEFLFYLFLLGEININYIK